MKFLFRRLARTLFISGAVSASVIGLVGCDEPAPLDPDLDVVRPVKALTIPAMTDDTTRRFPGRVRAAERVELAFSLSGKLIELPVDQGQLVTEGERVARLDPRDYQSALQAAQAQYNEAKANFERGGELVEQGHISRMDYDRLRANYEVAAAQLSTARKALADTDLVAPFDGIIARRYVDNFQEVSANQPVVSLQDNSVIEIVVDAPERTIAAAPGDGAATFAATFEALPGVEFPLTIREFSAEADPDTQTYEIVFAMPRPETANILSGMTANVLVRRPVAEDRGGAVIRIPAVAVFADAAGAPHVWVIADDGAVSPRAVKTGSLVGAERIEILSGLEPGETIAIAGVTRLRDGQVVRPVDAIAYD